MNKGLIGIQMSTIKDKIAELGAYGTLKSLRRAGISLRGGVSDPYDRGECCRHEEGL